MQRACALGAALLLLWGAASCRRRSSETPAREGPVVEPNVATPATKGVAAPAFPIAPGVRLAGSTSGLEVEGGMPVVSITPTEIQFDGETVIALADGAVPAAELRDGPEGYFVTPLYKRIERRVAELKARTNHPADRSYYGKVTIAPDARTRHEVLAKVLYTVAQGELHQFQFLVANTDGELRAIRFCQPPCCRNMNPPPCWGVPQAPPVDILRGGHIMGPDGGHVDAPEDGPEPVFQLNLMLTIADNGMRFYSPVALPQGCTSEAPPDGSRTPPAIGFQEGSGYDFEALRSCFVRIKARYPDQSHVIVSAARSIDWGTIVRVIDTAQAAPSSPLFPDFYLSNSLI